MNSIGAFPYLNQIRRIRLIEICLRRFYGLEFGHRWAVMVAIDQVIHSIPEERLDLVVQPANGILLFS